MGKSNKTPPNGQPRQKRRKALRQNRFRVCGLGMRNTGKTPFLFNLHNRAKMAGKNVGLFVASCRTDAMI